MSARAPGLAFALGTLLALLGAGEARAAALCTNTPGPNDAVSCIAADGVSGILFVNTSGDIDINLVNQAIASSSRTTPGVGVAGRQHGSMNEAVSVRLSGTTVTTAGGGAGASGVLGSIENTTSEGGVTIDVTGGAISTGESRAMGVYGYHSGTGDIDIDVTRSSVTTAGRTAYGFLGYHLGTGGDVDIDMTGGTVTTAGEDAHGVYGNVGNTASAGALTIDVTGGASIKTTGEGARGVYGYHRGTGGIDVDVTRSSVTTAGDDAHGVWGNVGNTASAGALTIDVTGGASIKTTGRAPAGSMAITWVRGTWTSA